MRRFTVAPLALVLLTGCAAEVDGPTPVVTRIVDTSIDNQGNDSICKCDDARCVNATYVLRVEGQGFAALPLRLLEPVSEEPDRGAALELPSVTLRPTRGGDRERVVHADNPGAETRLAYLDPEALELTLAEAFVDSLLRGEFDVTVQNPGGGEGTLSKGLELVLGPVLESVSPATASSAQETEITLTGQNFHKAARVIVGSANVLSKVTVLSARTIKATVLSGLQQGKINLRVENPEGCASVLDDGLEITP